LERCAGIEFSARQKAENEHQQTHMNQLQYLTFLKLQVFE